jgi:hypothetical protein
MACYVVSDSPIRPARCLAREKPIEKEAAIRGLLQAQGHAPEKPHALTAARNAKRKFHSGKWEMEARLDRDVGAEESVSRSGDGLAGVAAFSWEGTSHR